MNRSIIYLFIMLIVAGCGSDNDDPASSDQVSGTFSDSAVTAFSYTTGSVGARILKQSGKEALDFVIPSALAIEKSFSCLLGEQIEFNLTALVNNIDVATTCSSASQIEKELRIALLESLDGKTLKRTVTDAAYKDGQIDFSSSFQWNTSYYVVDIYKADDGRCSNGTYDGNMTNCTNNGHTWYGGSDFPDISNPTDTLRPCWAAYKFDKSTGKVQVNVSRIVSELNNGGAGTADFCADGGNNLVDFRFINGTMEFDWSGDNEFSPDRGKYAEGHAQGGQPCYDATTNEECESTYEKWEIL